MCDWGVKHSACHCEMSFILTGHITEKSQVIDCWLPSDVLNGLVSRFGRLPGVHLRLPLMAMLRACPNMTLAVEWDVTHQL